MSAQLDRLRASLGEWYTIDGVLGQGGMATVYRGRDVRFDRAVAEAAFKRALAADPNSPIAHQWYANCLAVAGRMDESEPEFRTALRLDPAPPVRRAAMAWVEAYRGNAARAVQWFDDAVRIDPDFSGVYTFGAIALEEAGRLDDALRAMERAVVLSDSAPANVAGLARLHALRGNTAKARSLLAQAISGRPAPAYEVAKAHLALGERAEAMRWFEKGYDLRGAGPQGRVVSGMRTVVTIT